MDVDDPDLSLDTLLAALKAAGETTRLRILAVLADGELTVSELCRILGQTQPRVSRHLKLLGEAGLLDRHTEGTSAFYGPSRDLGGRRVFRAVLELLDPEDATIVSDRERLRDIRAERAAAAAQYFEQIAAEWNDVRSLHVTDDDVEQAMLAAADAHRINGRRISTLLDVGTGTGRILEVFSDRVSRGLGIDLSSNMLNLARSNLMAKGLDHCAVRHGNIYTLDHTLDILPGSFDLAVLHHVLHFLDEPGRAVAVAGSSLLPGGQLIIVDFAPHELENLRSDHAHRRLGFEDHEVRQWCEQAGLTDVQATHLTPPSDGATAEPLTVTMWTATQSSSAPRSILSEADDVAS